MTQPRVAGAEVHGGDAQLGETGHVGPAIFRPHPPTGGFHQFRREGLVQAWGGCGCGVIKKDRETLGGAIGRAHLQHLVQVRQSLVHAAVRGVAEVDESPGLIGNGVGGHAGFGNDRVEALLVGQAVDLHVLRLIIRHAHQHTGQIVERVVAEPAASGVRASSQGGDLHADGSLAASLDHRPGRLAQQRQIAR